MTLDINVSGRKLRIRDAGGPMPLYVSRMLDADCAAALLAWARGAGLSGLVPTEELHVTVAYSRVAVDWFRFPSWFATDRVHVGAGGPRRIEVFKNGVVVLRFLSEALTRRWQEFRSGGCSWDFPDYAPHITLATDAGAADVARLKAFAGPLIFGPEEFAPITQ